MKLQIQEIDPERNITGVLLPERVLDKEIYNIAQMV